MSSLGRRTTAHRTSNSLGRNEADIIMFQERCGLVMKWFTNWSPAQRRFLLHEMLEDFSQDESDFLHQRTRRSVPQLRVDPAEALPRRLSLKILSYLDPRSLCRSGQVNWHWNWLSESNEIWLPKCNRLRWLLPAEGHHDIERTMRWTGAALLPAGVYKRLYMENLVSLQHDGVALQERGRLLETARRQDAAVEADRQSRLETARRRQLPLMQAPWQFSGGPGSAAAATHRFNVLDNRDIERMDSRKREPPARNTMRSVVQVHSGRPLRSSIQATGCAGSPERAGGLTASATLLSTTRSLHVTARALSESTTQTPAALWQAAAAAAAAAEDSAEDDAKADGKKKKDKKKKDKKKKPKEDKGSDDDKKDKKKKPKDDKGSDDDKKDKKKKPKEDKGSDDDKKDKKKKPKDDKGSDDDKKDKKKKPKDDKGSDDDKNDKKKKPKDDKGSDDDKKKKKKKKKNEEEDRVSEDEASKGDAEVPKAGKRQMQDEDSWRPRKLDLRSGTAGNGDQGLLTPDS